MREIRQSGSMRGRRKRCGPTAGAPVPYSTKPPKLMPARLTKGGESYARERINIRGELECLDANARVVNKSERENCSIQRWQALRSPFRFCSEKTGIWIVLAKFSRSRSSRVSTSIVLNCSVMECVQLPSSILLVKTKDARVSSPVGLPLCRSL